jgi:hypothetical protein
MNLTLLNALPCLAHMANVHFFPGTNTEAWTVCTTPEMDLMGVRNQEQLACNNRPNQAANHPSIHGASARKAHTALQQQKNLLFSP